MIVTTTPQLEGHRITRYIGIITGEAILGANIFKDLFAGIRDIVGGRSAAYEGELQKAKEIALQELQSRASAMAPTAPAVCLTRLLAAWARSISLTWPKS